MNSADDGNESTATTIYNGRPFVVIASPCLFIIIISMLFHESISRPEHERASGGHKYPILLFGIRLHSPFCIEHLMSMCGCTIRNALFPFALKCPIVWMAMFRVTPSSMHLIYHALFDFKEISMHCSFIYRCIVSVITKRISCKWI